MSNKSKNLLRAVLAIVVAIGILVASRYIYIYQINKQYTENIKTETFNNNKRDVR